MRVMTLSAALLLCSALLFGDDHSIDFDSHIDFSKFKTFTIHAGKINSSRPELSNTLVKTKIEDTMRAAFKARKLTETSDRPDIAANFTVDALDYSVGPGGRANPVRGSNGSGDRGRGRGSDNLSGQPVDFTEGTLVIDINTGDPAMLIWRGVYHDKEKSDVKLSEKLPDDAKKLISAFPPKGK